jgi:hypothetical protein
MRIVVIQGVGHSSIDESCIHNVALQAMAQDRSLGFSPKLLDRFDQDPTQRLMRPSQRYSQEVQEAALGLVDHLLGEGFVGCFYDIASQEFGYLHFSLRLRAEIPNESQNPNIKSLGQIPHEFRLGACGLIF